MYIHIYNKHTYIYGYVWVLSLKKGPGKIQRWKVYNLIYLCPETNCAWYCIERVRIGRKAASGSVLYRFFFRSNLYPNQFRLFIIGCVCTRTNYPLYNYSYLLDMFIWINATISFHLT